MKFKYTAKKGPDEIVEGVIDAFNQDNAVSKVRQMGLYPMSVSVSTQNVKKSNKPKAIQRKKTTVKIIGKVTHKQIYFFTKKLKVLLKAQEPLLGSLYFIEDQGDSIELKKIIRSIIESIKEGGSFSEGLEKYPKYFSPLYVNIVRAGEAGGNLDYALEQITKYLDKERQLSQKVISALAYPIMMISVGFAAVIFMMTFVIPKLESLFEDFTDQLPLATKALLSLSRIFENYWMVMVFVFVGVVVFLIYSREAAWFKKLIEIMKKKIPVVNNIIFTQSLCRLASGLAILISSGVSLLNSIRISVPLIEDEIFQKQLYTACDQIVSGSGLEESLRDNCSFLPDMFIKMVAVGETSGRLEEVLLELSSNYSDEVDSMTKIVTSLIEPLAILIVGGVLGFIVIAILLPIFEISMFVN